MDVDFGHRSSPYYIALWSFRTIREDYPLCHEFSDVADLYGADHNEVLLNAGYDTWMDDPYATADEKLRVYNKAVELLNKMLDTRETPQSLAVKLTTGEVNYNSF